MSVSILVVDDEPDVADLFRQRFRREARQGTYVMRFAASGRRHWTGPRRKFSPHSSRCCLTSICRAWIDWNCSARSYSVTRPAGDDGDRVWRR